MRPDPSWPAASRHQPGSPQGQGLVLHHHLLSPAQWASHPLPPPPTLNPAPAPESSAEAAACRVAAGQRPPPASAPGPAVDRQQLTSTSRFLWADARSSGTLHSHSFNPGRSALLLSPSRGGENCCKETLICRGSWSWSRVSQAPLQYTVLRGPFPVLLLLSE